MSKASKNEGVFDFPFDRGVLGPDPLPGESPRAFLAVCIYCDLGPKRTLNQAWRAYCRAVPETSSQPTGRPGESDPGTDTTPAPTCPGQWTALSSRYRWVERAQAYDVRIEAARQTVRSQVRTEHSDQLFDLACRNQDRLDYQVQLLKGLLERLPHLAPTEVVQQSTEKVGTTVTRTYRRVGGKSISAEMALIGEYCEILTDAGLGALYRHKSKRKYIPANQLPAIHENPAEANQKSREGDSEPVTIVLSEEEFAVFGHPTNASGREVAERESIDLGPGPERLPEESARDYAAFCVYRDLGPGRTLNAAWQAYRANSSPTAPGRGRPRTQHGTTPCSGAWTARSAKYHWLERGLAYDLALAQEVRVQQHRQDLEQLRGSARRNLKSRMDRVKMREQLMEKLLTELQDMESLPLQDIRHTQHVRIGRQKVSQTTYRDIQGIALSGFTPCTK